MADDIYMDIHKIIELLPHRYPFLLVDRVLECEPSEFITAVKNVTMNEPFFTGHFPQRPVMPGVMILESMAQATGLLTFATFGGPEADTLYYFVGIDKARFKRKVEPGDQLILHAKLMHHKRLLWKFAVTAKVDGSLAAEAELMCAARKFET